MNPINCNLEKIVNRSSFNTFSPNFSAVLTMKLDMNMISPLRIIRNSVYDCSCGRKRMKIRPRYTISITKYSCVRFNILANLSSWHSYLCNIIMMIPRIRIELGSTSVVGNWDWIRTIRTDKDWITAANMLAANDRKRNAIQIAFAVGEWRGTHTWSHSPTHSLQRLWRHAQSI